MGLALLGIGVFAYQDGKTLSQLVDGTSKELGSDFTAEIYGTAALAMIIISCVIVVVSFFGCCGAWKVCFKVFYHTLQWKFNGMLFFTWS